MKVWCPLTQDADRSTDICVSLVKRTALAPQGEHWTFDRASGLSIPIVVCPIERSRCAVLLTDSVNGLSRAKRIYVFSAHVGGKMEESEPH
jgi:hypothetical protein